MIGQIKYFCSHISNSSSSCLCVWILLIRCLCFCSLTNLCISCNPVRFTLYGAIYSLNQSGGRLEKKPWSSLAVLVGMKSHKRWIKIAHEIKKIKKSYMRSKNSILVKKFLASGCQVTGVFLARLWETNMHKCCK